MKSIIIFMTEGQKTMVLAAIDAAEIWESATGKKEMTLRVGSEFFKTLKELVADRLDYSKHIPVDESCEDCVNREVVLDKIKEVCFSKEQKWVDFRVSHGSNGQRDFIINFIESLPSVTPVFRWIPIKENPFSELPKDRRVWVTKEDSYGYRYVSDVAWDLKRFDDEVMNVVAYMDYYEPVPYKESEETE